VAAFAVSVLTIAWGVRLLGRVSPRLLLSGRTEDDLATANNGVPWWLYGVIGLCVIGGATLLLIGPTLKGHEAQAGTFFGSGAFPDGGSVWGLCLDGAVHAAGNRRL
jgi:hypothetical protein